MSENQPQQTTSVPQQSNIQAVNIQAVNIHAAKTHLSRIVEDVKRQGTPIIIAKAGVPQVKIVPLEQPKKQRKMGTLKGKINVPDDFDHAFEQQIEQMFVHGVFNDGAEM